jgi:hypothetical protein
MSILEDPIALLDGTPTTLGDITAGRAALLVNVASKCGLTSQYAALEDLHAKYTARGFTVIGFPCNQFGGQEPGTSEEIAEFCSATYGVTFPMTEKIEVNGPRPPPDLQGAHPRAEREGRGRRHPLELREVPGRPLVAGVVVLGAIMSILDITVVSSPCRRSRRPSTPPGAGRLDDDRLHAGAGHGDPADRLGGRPVRHQAALHARDLLFTAGSVLCADGDLSIEMLVTFRVLQGLGGGMLMPLGMTIMTRAAGPRADRPRDGDPRRPDAARPDLRPDPRRLADRHRQLALDLPDQRADRHRRDRLRRDRAAQGHPEPSESFDFLGMLLLSPGLALFLYGVSSIPGRQAGARHDLDTRRCSCSRSSARSWSSRSSSVGAPQERPPADRPAPVPQPQMTVAVIAMACSRSRSSAPSLLFPLYFQQVRGETTLRPVCWWPRRASARC